MKAPNRTLTAALTAAWISAVMMVIRMDIDPIGRVALLPAFLFGATVLVVGSGLALGVYRSELRALGYLAGCLFSCLINLAWLILR